MTAPARPPPEYFPPELTETGVRRRSRHVSVFESAATVTAWRIEDRGGVAVAIDQEVDGDRVSGGGGGRVFLDPAGARHLAALLIRLADEAEAAGPPLPPARATGGEPDG